MAARKSSGYTPLGGVYALFLRCLSWTVGGRAAKTTKKKKGRHACQPMLQKLSRRCNRCSQCYFPHSSLTHQLAVRFIRFLHLDTVTSISSAQTTSPLLSFLLSPFLHHFFFWPLSALCLSFHSHLPSSHASSAKASQSLSLFIFQFLSGPSC